MKPLFNSVFIAFVSIKVFKESHSACTCTIMADQLATQSDLQASWNHFIDEFNNLHQKSSQSDKLVTLDCSDLTGVRARIDALLPEQSPSKAKTKDFIMKTLKCVELFGQIVLQGASLVWGPAQVCQNAMVTVIGAMQGYGRAFEDLEPLMECMNAFLTALYSTLLKADYRNVSEAMREVCSDVLGHFLDVLKEIYSLVGSKRERAKLRTKNMFLDENPIAADLQKMEQRITRFTGIATMEILATVSASAQEIRLLPSIHDGVDMLVSAEVLREIDQSLALNSDNCININTTRHETISSQAIAGTGEWILNDGEFLDWADPSKLPKCPVFAIGEMEKTGKTFLSNRIIRHLQSTRNGNHQKRRVVAYYYFAPGGRATELDSVWIGRAVRSIVWQLIRVDAFFAKRIHELCKGDSAFQTREHLWRSLIEHAKCSGRTIFIVLDGCLRMTPDARQTVASMVSDVHSSDLSARLRLHLSGRPISFELLQDELLPQHKLSWKLFGKGPNRRNTNDLALVIAKRLPGEDYGEIRLQVLDTASECLNDMYFFNKFEDLLSAVEKETERDRIDSLLLATRLKADDDAIEELERRLARLADLTPSLAEDLVTILAWVIAGGKRSPISLTLLKQVTALKHRGKGIGNLERHLRERYNHLLGLFPSGNQTYIRFWGNLPVDSYMDRQERILDESHIPQPVRREDGTMPATKLVAEIEAFRGALRSLCNPHLYQLLGLDEFLASKLALVEKAQREKSRGIYLDRHDSYLRVVSDCLRAACDFPAEEAYGEIHAFAARNLARHLNLVDFGKVDAKTKQAIGLQMYSLCKGGAAGTSWWKAQQQEEFDAQALWRAGARWWNEPEVAKVLVNSAQIDGGLN